MRSFKIIGLAACAAIAVPASGATIDFESETLGAKGNGYTVGGIIFYDSLGGDLQVGQWQESNNTKGLAVFGDDTSALRMFFFAPTNSLSLSFGNDEVCVPGNCTFGADRAYLQVFLGGNEVGSAFTLFNQNNIADQQVGVTGVIFDQARLTYVNSAFQAGNLIEIVDNINFTTAPVPEPGTWAMMILGFGMVGGALRSTKRRSRFSASYA